MSDAIREKYRKQFPKYDKWSNYEWDWWKKEGSPKVNVPMCKGDKPFKWPVVKPSGKMTVGPIDIEKRYKICSNAWRNFMFAQMVVLQEELGKETAEAMVGYAQLALNKAVMGFVHKFLGDDLPNDCTKLSKISEMELLLEGDDCDVIEETPDRSTFRMSCAWWADWYEKWEVKGIDLREFMCGIACDGWFHELAQTVSPKYGCRRTAWHCAGDPYCEFQFYKMDDE